MAQLLLQRDFDVLWIYSELFPYLPGQFERLAFQAGKPVVYDFDDAFFHQYDRHPSWLFRKLLADKLEPLLSGAAACTCANDYLRDYAAAFCERSVLLPTVVNTDLYKPSVPRTTLIGRPLCIGWIGSPTTWAYVRPLLPVLSSLADQYGLEVRVVGAGAAAVSDIFPGLRLIEWSEETEIAEVQRMDIGIMPIPDEPWTRGKSGYKLIQYMACGLPVVASPVGANREIVVQGQTGLFASDSHEWRNALERLIAEEPLRTALGAAGRLRAERNYSTQLHAPRLIALLQSLRGRLSRSSH
jgi:glycosyltransferase involved in cell wall biosynthesis